MNQFEYIPNRDTRLNLETLDEQDECKFEAFYVYNSVKLGQKLTAERCSDSGFERKFFIFTSV